MYPAGGVSRDDKRLLRLLDQLFDANNPLKIERIYF
jgi:hypothetical protein